MRIRVVHSRCSASCSRAQFADAEFFGVSGALAEITEVAAIQRALRETGETFDAVASLGGESFLVYLLADGRIGHVLSHNKCAAGSGEFFVQQIGRMGLGIDKAIRRSFAGRVIPLAARCSVHCKLDITHKLNRHEATPEDILHTLHDSMANKVLALLEKSQREAQSGAAAAREFLEQSGRVPGRDLDNWLEAKACLESCVPRHQSHRRLHEHVTSTAATGRAHAA